MPMMSAHSGGRAIELILEAPFAPDVGVDRLPHPSHEDNEPGEVYSSVP